MYLMDGQFDSRGNKWIERCHLNLLFLYVFFTVFGEMFKYNAFKFFNTISVIKLIIVFASYIRNGFQPPHLGLH